MAQCNCKKVYLKVSGGIKKDVRREPISQILKNAFEFPGGGHHSFIVSHLINMQGDGNPLQYSCLENPGWMSLMGYSSWGLRESDTTEQLN